MNIGHPEVRRVKACLHEPRSRHFRLLGCLGCHVITNLIIVVFKWRDLGKTEPDRTM